MMDGDFARNFAEEWIEAWNARDLDRVLSHYDDDFEMKSPVIVDFAGEPSGTLRGKAAVRAYWGSALERLPDLHFELIDVLTGVDSLTIYYKGHRGMVAEVLEIPGGERVLRASAHYAA